MVKIFYCNCEESESHEFLLYVFKKYYGKAYNEKDLMKTNYGKLFFYDSPFKFCISHSKGVLAIAVGERELGLDIEVLRDKSFSKLNNAYFGNTANDIEEFFSLWTKAESFVKYSAGSILTELKKIKLIGNDIYYEDLIQPIKNKTLKIENFILSLTSEDLDTEIIKCDDF